MKNLLKKNYKLILGIILGVILTSGVVFAASISSNNVTFDNSQSGISATTVQEAIDELYQKAIPDNMLTSKVLANNTGVCMYRKGRWHCFKINNFNTEKTHIQQVFSDVGTYNSSTGLGCDVYSSAVNCAASDFGCDVHSDGGVYCGDYAAGSYCDVDSDGSVNCDQ